MATLTRIDYAVVTRVAGRGMRDVEVGRPVANQVDAVHDRHDATPHRRLLNKWRYWAERTQPSGSSIGTITTSTPHRSPTYGA